MKRKLVTILMVFSLTTFMLSANGGSVPTVSAFSYQQLTDLQKRLLSGFAELELNPANATDSIVASSSSGPDRSPVQPTNPVLRA